jgi:hypothetical protein
MGRTIHDDKRRSCKRLGLSISEAEQIQDEAWTAYLSDAAGDPTLPT